MPERIDVSSEETPQDFAVRVSRLTYAVGNKRLINGLDLEVTRAGCTAVMGYNGAGKSVLLKLLHGLHTPTAGDIQWRKADGQNQLRQSMVFQTPVLLKRSVEENIVYALKVKGYRGAKLRDRLDWSIEEGQLQSLKKRPARVLSGGERQRVALCRALATEPDVVLMDEPTASLDPATIITIEDTIQRAIARGCKIILVTQSVGQAGRLASDVVFMHHGQVTEHSSTDIFMSDTRSAAARAFINGQLFE